MTWEPTDSASSSSSLPKPRFGPSCCYSTYSPSSIVLPSCLTIANRPPFAPRFSLAEPFWAAPDGGWLFICHKAGVVCKPETLCSTTSSLGNSQFRRSWIPLSPPDLNHQLKSLPIESNFGIQVRRPAPAIHIGNSVREVDAPVHQLRRWKHLDAFLQQCFIGWIQRGRHLPVLHANLHPLLERHNLPLLFRVLRALKQSLCWRERLPRHLLLTRFFH